MYQKFKSATNHKALKIGEQKIDAYFIAHDLEFWRENAAHLSTNEVGFKVIPYIYFLENNIEITKSNPLVFELNVARQSSLEVQLIISLAIKGFNCLVIKPSGEKKLDLPKLENMRTIEWPFSSQNLISSLGEFENLNDTYLSTSLITTNVI